MHDFGPWADPDSSLTKYLEQKDALHSDRKARKTAEEVTLKMLCNAYLNHKKALASDNSGRDTAERPASRHSS